MAADAGTATLSAPPVKLNRPALFLDMDGVLAPFAPTPEAVVPVARRTAVLRLLDERLGGRMAIVSGRSLSEIDRISGSSARSASGVHGLERRRRDGSLQSAQAAPGVRAAVAAFDAFAAERPGVIVEDKGVSAGLHFRQAPDAEVEATALAQRLIGETGLALQAGDTGRWPEFLALLETVGPDQYDAIIDGSLATFQFALEAYHQGVS